MENDLVFMDSPRKLDSDPGSAAKPMDGSLTSQAFHILRKALVKCLQ